MKTFALQNNLYAKVIISKESLHSFQTVVFW